MCSQCTRWSGLGATDILSQALNISEDDRGALRGWYERHFAPYRILSASPAFVKRVVQERGGESIKAAFHFPKDSPDYWLEYLLRCHKGHFFRKRHPPLSVL